MMDFREIGSNEFLGNLDGMLDSLINRIYFWNDSVIETSYDYFVEISLTLACLLNYWISSAILDLVQ